MKEWLKSKLGRISIHILLFIVTFLTTTLAGSEWTYGKLFLSDDFTMSDFMGGLPYAIVFLGILTVHEFGHYFVALWHRVRTSLPYYIPFYIPFLSFSLGTLGAVIRLRERPRSTTQHFDIGLAGPLAGFIVALFVLIYGFTFLPPLDYLFSIHPEYAPFGSDYAAHVYSAPFVNEGTVNITIGKNLLFLLLENLADPALLPHPGELMHYPLLFAGFLALVVTSINLLPIGQLDGGHILYGLVGYKNHKIIASVIFIIFMFYAGLGYVSPFDTLPHLLYKIPLMIGFYYIALSRMGLSTITTITVAVVIFAIQLLTVRLFPAAQGYSGWLLFVLVIGRFLGIEHPPSEIEEPLTPIRKVMGWMALAIFILCFSPNPISITLYEDIIPSRIDSLTMGL